MFPESQRRAPPDVAFTGFDARASRLGARGLRGAARLRTARSAPLALPALPTLPPDFRDARAFAMTAYATVGRVRRQPRRVRGWFVLRRGPTASARGRARCSRRPMLDSPPPPQPADVDADLLALAVGEAEHEHGECSTRSTPSSAASCGARPATAVPRQDRPDFGCERARRARASHRARRARRGPDRREGVARGGRRAARIAAGVGAAHGARVVERRRDIAGRARLRDRARGRPARRLPFRQVPDRRTQPASRGGGLHARPPAGRRRRRRARLRARSLDGQARSRARAIW